MLLVNDAETNPSSFQMLQGHFLEFSGFSFEIQFYTLCILSVCIRAQWTARLPNPGYAAHWPTNMLTRRRLTCVENACDDSSSARRYETTQKVGTTRHWDAGDVHIVFNCQRLAG